MNAEELDKRLDVVMWGTFLLSLAFSQAREVEPRAEEMRLVILAVLEASTLTTFMIRGYIWRSIAWWIFLINTILGIRGAS